MDTATLSVVVQAIAVCAITILIALHVTTKQSLSDKVNYADQLVRAAEEAFGALGGGDQKFEFAVDSMLGKFGIDKHEAETLIQSAVLGLRQAGIKTNAMPSK